MNSHSYQRVGAIAFESFDDAPFPTLATVLDDGYTTWPPELSHFLVAASDPARINYFNDECEAIDLVNFAVIKTSAPDAVDVHLERHDEISAAVEAGVAIYHGHSETLLIVDPGNEELVSELEQLRGALLDYPVLDEGAFAERDLDAWNEFLHGGLRHDTTRDLRQAGVDDDTVDAIDDAWSTIAPLAASKLDYFNGFSGEHSPDFTVLVARTMAGIAEQLQPVVTGPGDERAVHLRHLHREDCPRTLAILSALFSNRLEDASHIGFEPTEHGALVDWNKLDSSWLSTTEKAVVTLAQGISSLERQGGGLPPHLAITVRAAVAAVAGGPSPTGGGTRARLGSYAHGPTSGAIGRLPGGDDLGAVEGQR